MGDRARGPAAVRLATHARGNRPAGRGDQPRPRRPSGPAAAASWCVRRWPEAGVRPETLCFEIGESVAATHGAASERLVRELRSAGCRVTLEHCGSGTAAFGLLRRLQVDFLKIAGPIVRGLSRDPVDRALANALVEIGRALRLGTIGAEAESPEVLACLRELGVDYAQGYGVGRPEPLDSALERLVTPGSGTFGNQ